MDSLLRHIDKTDYQAFDVETTGLNVRKDKVIGYGICGQIGVAYYVPIYEYDPETEELIALNTDLDVIAPLKKLKQIVTWNGSFDGRITKNDLKVDLIPNIVSEVMLMKHTLEEEGPFGLKDNAIEFQNEIGIDAESEANEEQLILKENIKERGGSVTKTNFELYKAEMEIIGRYCCADVDLTLRLHDLFYARIEKEGLWDFFYHDEVMPLYREVTIPMEEHGVALDMDLLLSTRDEIKEDMDKLHERVLDALEDSVEFQNWLVSTALSKFPAKPSGLFGQAVARHYKLDLPVNDKGKYSLSKKGVEALPDSIAKSFLLKEDVTLDKEVEEDIAVELWKKKNEGFINISSKKQMGELVFDWYGYKPLSKTDKGAPQFNETMINHLADDGLDWARKLRLYNKLVKINSSYIMRFIDNQEDGYYYFSYKQHGTISGRYGSDAQQMPRPMEEGEDDPLVLKYANRVRKFFVAGEGRKLVDCDYESLEPHCVDEYSIVSTENGIKYIKDTFIGEKIYTKDGLRTILNKWNSEKPTLNIMTRKGSIKCSPDHKIYVQGKGFIKAGVIEKGDVLEEIKFTEVPTSNTNNLKRPVYLKGSDRPFASLEVDHDLSWMLGAFIGDGIHNDKYIGICGLEQDGVVQKFKNIMSDKMGATPKEYNDSRTEGMVSYRYHDSWLCSIFDKTFDVVKNGKKVLRVPTYIINSDCITKLNFLAGLIDTDGTYNTKKSELSISTKSSELATDIITLGNTLGLDGRISLAHKKTKGKVHLMYQIRFTTMSINRLFELGLQEFTVCERKKLFEKRMVGKKAIPEAEVLEILESPESKMIDITVEDNEEFICNNLRVHNCFAHVAGDDGLKDIFHKGHDFYSTIAIATEGLKEVSADKKAENYLGKVSKQLRQAAKSYSLGVPYGMSPYALAKSLEIETEEAEELVDKYLNAYPDLKEWMQRSNYMAQNKGYVKSEVGRVRHLGKVKEIHKFHGTKMLDFKYRNKITKQYKISGLSKEEAEKKVKNMYLDYKNGLNNSKNFQIQSLAGSIVNRAAIAVTREFKKRGINGWCAAQIHDQLIFNVPEKEKEKCRVVVQELMENTTKLSIDLKAPAELGDNWYEAH